jgi:hypothetical protein
MQCRKLQQQQKSYRYSSQNHGRKDTSVVGTEETRQAGGRKQDMREEAEERRRSFAVS